MNKSEIRAELEQIAKDAGYPKGVVTDLFEAFIDIMVDSLASGEDVKLANFGKFTIRDRPPVIRQNPRDGTQLQIGPKRAVLFRPAPALKDRLNP